MKVSFFNLKRLALLASMQASCNLAFSSDVCDIALTSGAFNTSDFTQNSKFLLKKRDDACKNEYNSQSEATSAGSQSGGNIGYGGFSLGLSDAKQKSNGKWSIADSKFCNASAEELDTFTSTIAKQQVADVALKAWSECRDKTNKLFVQYTLNADGSGMTGTIFRSVSDNGAFGNITGIMTSNPQATLDCRIGTTSIEANKQIKIKIEKGKIGISCNKDPKTSQKLQLLTDIGDQEWISLPSQTEQKQLGISETNDAVNQLRLQIQSLSNDMASKNQSTNKSIQSLADTTKNQIDGLQKLLNITYGGSYSRSDLGGNNQFKNPLTNDYSCPPGYQVYQAARYRTAEAEQGANLYICIAKH